MRWIWLAVSLALVLLSSSVQAQGTESVGAAPPPGRDHRGLLVSVSAGAGFLGVFGDHFDEDGSLRGGAQLWSLSIGGSLDERLTLHAVYFGAGAWDPKFRTEVENSEYFSYQLTTHNVGLGLTHYTPSNWSLGGRLAFAIALVNTLGGSDPDLGLGPVLGGLLGKEWFVARNFGLGLVANVDFIHLNLDYSGTRSGVSTGASFTITYN